MTQRQMHLVAYLKTGPTSNYPGAWRHPESPLDDILQPERYEHLARVLEAARFDGCFFADTFGLSDTYKDGFATHLGRGGQISYLDPLAVLPLMARVTRHLGLGATLSTTLYPAYHLARTLASLDHVSAGRIAWNIVTSATDLEARNYGMESLPPKEQRYDQADEVLEACCALWEGWAPDALLLDKASGRFADPGKVHYAHYAGRYVRTRGPLSIPRSPQGRPVLMQAGTSDRGREFAARWAELVFINAETLEDAARYRADLSARMARYGRAPEECAVLPSLAVVIGETEAIAQEKAAYLATLSDPELVLAWNSAMIGADLTRVATEAEAVAAAGHTGIEGSRNRVLQVAREQGISFAEAARKPRGLVVGTAQGVADRMEAWFRAGACDGFILWPTISPRMFEEFGRFVVPELQRRGVFRREYEGRTLRDNLRC
ncbi:NtaA/DmoA family FMN-dependent monooxygenase [Siccirubricoccus phaeus]|uniref:NtaA/DmoA family FMN-dependent monooxygenase n=1 Tax=Siccirubricoccus phaeus TaxID=2595053 RepID=UPI0011F3498F|nr:NtaA/DmoA family FMN-dependent monooxygenase [Siccirubricoccus phaeus]